MIYKFADDQGTYLVALITFYGFLSLFPLLLLLVTVLGFLLEGDPHLQAKFVDSALTQFPVIGSQLRENVSSLSGSGVGLIVAVATMLYGCLGVGAAVQNAFNRAWAIPRNRRPNLLATRLRSLLLLPIFGIAILATTGLSGLTTGADAYGADISAGIAVIALFLATLINIALFAGAFRLLTTTDVPGRHMLIGAAVAGVGWQLVQIGGTYLVSNALRGSQETYGVFGLVLGLLGWIYLLALITVIAAETTVVHARRLWPRSLLTPFTDRVELTSADERAYTGYAVSEGRKGFQIIDVGFDPRRHANPEGDKDQA